MSGGKLFEDSLKSINPLKAIKSLDFSSLFSSNICQNLEKVGALASNIQVNYREPYYRISLKIPTVISVNGIRFDQTSNIPLPVFVGIQKELYFVFNSQGEIYVVDITNPNDMIELIQTLSKLFKMQGITNEGVMEFVTKLTMTNNMRLHIEECRRNP